MEKLKLNIEAYRIKKVLGTGGFGIVYQALQKSTGQSVALKVLQLDKTLDPHRQRRLVERFERESQLCAQLHHPHIVQLLDKGQTGDHQLYAVFEHVPGETLKELLLRKGALSAIETGELMGPVLNALAYAHEQGVVHRDLKPHNFMITTTGNRSYAKILDFGVGAFTPEARQANYKTLTLTQEALGTPSYSAPEQLRGEPPTVKSDLYAWGLVFLECLTGIPAIQGSSLAEIFHKQLHPAEVPLPPALLGHPLGNLLRRVLKKNPNERAKSADQLYQELGKINLGQLVGTIVSESHQTGLHEEMTDALDGRFWGRLKGERRQITALCCRFRIATIEGISPEFEALDALQNDQLQHCMDIGVRYGGYLVGSLGDCLLFYFGYPHVSDTDVRRAARTALELISESQQRSALIEQNHGVRLELQVGLHTGPVLIHPNQIPTGLTPNLAMRLEKQAGPNTIVVSDETRRLLETYAQFEPFTAHPIGGGAQPISTFLLTQERRTEALTFFKKGLTQTLVGRQEEFTTLKKVWNQSLKQGTRSILLTGEPGIGKTRLSYELRQWVKQQGYSAETFRCFPEYRNEALHPIFALLKRYLQLKEQDDLNTNIAKLQSFLEEHDPPLEQTLPIFCSWLSLPLPQEFAASQQTPDQQKQILLNILKHWILQLGGSKPVLVIFEDLHWIDPTSKELLDQIVMSEGKQPVLLVLTARPEFHNDWQDSPVISILLQKLSQPAVQEMIQKIVGKCSIDARTLSYLSERVDGIALFAEELVRMLLDNGTLVEKSGTMVLDEKAPTESIPNSLRDLLNERLLRLGPTRETAQLAATMGREFDYELLIQTALRDEATVQWDLEQMINTDLVYRQRKVQGSAYIFRHALIRDAAYDSMFKSDKEQVHGRIARVLEESFPQVIQERPAEIGRHYAAATQYERAVAYGIQATKNAYSQATNEETIALGQQALSWNQVRPPSIAKDQDELSLQETLFQAVMAVNGLGSPELLQVNSRINDLIESLDQQSDGESKWKNYEVEHLNQWVNFQNLMFSARFDQAIELGETLVKKAFQLDHREKALTVLPLLGQCYATTGNYEKGMAKCAGALNLYREEEDQTLWMQQGVDPKSQGLFLLGLFKACMGLPETGIRLCKESMDWAKKTGNIFTYEMAVFEIGLISFLTKDTETIGKLTHHFKDFHSSTGQDQWAAVIYRVLYEWITLKTDHSFKYIEECVQTNRTGILSWFERMLAETLMEQGNTQQTIDFLKPVIRRCRQNNDRWMLHGLEALLGEAFYYHNRSLMLQVEKQFEIALKEAQAQQTVWIEFDIAWKYSKILYQENKFEEVHALLEPFLKTLKEGQQTPLYLEAQHLFKKVVG